MERIKPLKARLHIELADHQRAEYAHCMLRVPNVLKGSCCITSYSIKQELLVSWMLILRTRENGRELDPSPAFFQGQTPSISRMWGMKQAARTTNSVQSNHRPWTLSKIRPA